MTNMATIVIEFTSFWRSGSGASGGGDVDATALRDPHRLPYVPARQLKGLLREGGLTLEQAGAPRWLPGQTELLFGRAADGEKESLPAALDFRDARLGEDIERAVSANSILTETLFARLSSTAIDADTGAAKSKALRSFEAVVPLTLQAPVFWAPDERLQRSTEDRERCAALEGEWKARLDECAALILAIGGQRSDGLGRAIVSVISEIGADT